MMHSIVFICRKMKPTSKNDSEPVTDALEAYIGKKLRQRRLARDLTQTQLGEMVGVTFQQMQKYERGVNRISASKLYEFSLALNVPISFFFEGAPPPQTNPSAGFRENTQDDPADDRNFENQERSELMHYYFSIPNPKKRKVVLDLIRTMTEQED